MCKSRSRCLFLVRKDLTRAANEAGERNVDVSARQHVIPRKYLEDFPDGSMLAGD